MSKLTIQAVNKAHQAAADMNTAANAVRNALSKRLSDDHRMALDLNMLFVSMRTEFDNLPGGANVPAEFRDQLEPTANSYGFTLVDHPTRRDLVVVQPL